MLLALIALLIGAHIGQPEPETHWYGWQTLLTDAGAVALSAWAFKLGTKSGGDEVFLVAEGAFLFGGPLVHGVHGQLRRSAGDFALRLLLPVGLALVLGAGAPSGPDTYCGACAGALGGLVLGAGIASLLDAVWLSWEPATVRASLRVTPMLAWMRDREGKERPAVGLLAAF